MKEKITFGIIGGDMRQAKLAQLLEADGHAVHIFGFDRQPELVSSQSVNTLQQAASADCVVLPLPVTDEHENLNAPISCGVIRIADVLDAMPQGQIVCGGRIPEEIFRMASERKLRLTDYFAREELAIANAVPTAEGVLQIAMEELPITLAGSRVLVMGFGHTGKIIAHRLHALGALVTVSARRYSDLAWIRAYGYRQEFTEALDGRLDGYDLIVNTVPHKILNEARLQELSPGCLCIDIASRPGGLDFDAASRLGVKAIWALSLPGKVAPVTSGAIIKETIYHILQELGVIQ